MKESNIVFRGDNNQALTSSLLVAREFGKEHSKVMRDIGNLACSQEFRAANFGASSYKSEQGKEFPMCTMTKEGKQSKLDIATKHGFLGKMFDIVSRMIKER